MKLTCLCILFMWVCAIKTKRLKILAETQCLSFVAYRYICIHSLIKPPRMISLKKKMAVPGRATGLYGADPVRTIRAMAPIYHFDVRAEIASRLHASPSPLRGGESSIFERRRGCSSSGRRPKTIIVSNERPKESHVSRFGLSAAALTQ